MTLEERMRALVKAFGQRADSCEAVAVGQVKRKEYGQAAYSHGLSRAWQGAADELAEILGSAEFEQPTAPKPAERRRPYVGATVLYQTPMGERTAFVVSIGEKGMHLRVLERTHPGHGAVGCFDSEVATNIDGRDWRWPDA